MDWHDIVYYLFHVLGFLGVTFFAIIYSKKFNLAFWRVGLCVVCTYIVGYAFMYFQCWVESGFRVFGGNNIVRTFIWIPLLAWPFAKLFKIDWKLSTVIIAPMLCIIHGISHFGCIFAGCCYGYPWEYGIYNHVFDTNLFPIQIIEALVAIAIVIMTIVWTHNHNYDRNCKAYPLMLILFGSTRFILEFFRDNTKLFWGLSDLAIHAFVMFVVGMIWFFLPWDKIIEKMKNKGKKEEAQVEVNNTENRP